MEISLENDRENHSVIKHYIGMSMNQMRHLEVDRIIEERHITSFIDFGCSEGLLLQKLSRSDAIQLAIGVDKDETALSSAVLNTFPENIQQSIQFRREHDQHLFIYCGDATKKYPQIKEKNAQMVTMIELIEHLPPEDISKVTQNVFGYLKPQLCFISTPNKEFNAFFEFEEGQMRHWDHKFEWTRAQFQQFCEGVKEKYGYEFTLGGVGEHTSDLSKGFCTQYALFSRPVATATSVEISASPQKDNDLEERAHYQNKSWKNNLEKIMRSILYKTLYYQADITFTDAAEFIQKQPIGTCLRSIGQVVDRDFIVGYLELNRNDFEWDDDKYSVKQQPYSESQMVGNQQVQEEYVFDQSSFSNNLSVSKSNLFGNEEKEPIQ